jgi:hypothetical protein
LVQQYYHHSPNPTPPMLQCSTMLQCSNSEHLLRWCSAALWCNAVYMAMLHHYSASQIQGKNHAMLQHNIGAKV